MTLVPEERETRWARLTRVTSFPVLWIAIYLLWLVFSASFCFWLLPLGETLVRAVVFVLAGLLPLLLIWVSNRMAKSAMEQGSAK